MEIKGKVHCFFEQSGTFKNELIKLGIPADMKARVKATGEIWTFSQIDEITFKSAINGHLYCAEELEFVEPSAFSPDYGCSEQKDKQKKTIMSRKGASKAEERSMISTDYARNFICDFIIGKEQIGTQLTIF